MPMHILQYSVLLGLRRNGARARLVAVVKWTVVNSGAINALHVHLSADLRLIKKG